MVEHPRRRHPDTTWLDGVYETIWRQSTPYGRGYGLLSAAFLLASAVFAVWFVVHQQQAAAVRQDREQTYQQQVDDALAGQYGLTAANSGLLPFADHDSTLVRLVEMRGDAGSPSRLCTVATGGSPDQVTVSCPEQVIPSPEASSPAPG